MAQAFNGFKSDNGKTFDNEHAAWVEDLRVFLLECSAVNDGNVNGLIEHITKPRDRMRRFVGILDRIAATHPELDQPVPSAVAPLCSIIGANTGHGHVWSRPDGLKARCGGPAMCEHCQRDKITYEQCEAAGQLPDEFDTPQDIRSEMIHHGA